MGKRGGKGGGKGGKGGGVSDQYGDGWSGQDRSDYNSEGGGKGEGKGGKGGGRGGGSAGGGGKKSSVNVSYQRNLPKFLQAHAELLGGEKDAHKLAWDEHAASALRGYGDSDDEEAAARAGLGANSARADAASKANRMATAFGLNDSEATEAEKEDMAKEEKGLGNRAFQDGRFSEAVTHFSRCIKLDS
ncbi:hypothetical protein CYMTET_8905, partial [Cymbomonas tetramitiformis]